MPASLIVPDLSPVGGTCGGIWHLPDALERYPDADLLVYHRVSSYNQAGKGKVKLEAMTDALFTEVCKIALGSVWPVPFFGVEEGKLSKRRPTLLKAVEYARPRGLMLVARDLSRFVRSEDYCRRTNPEAWPTPAEFARLHEMTGGVILATLEPPTLTEAERQSRATKRSEKCGRPRSLVWPQTLAILEAYEESHVLWHIDRGGGLGAIARRFGVTKSAVQRLLDEVNPYSNPPMRWKDFYRPSEVYRKAREQDCPHQRIASLWPRQES
jgi:hypothetical protein